MEQAELQYAAWIERLDAGDAEVRHDLGEGEFKLGRIADNDAVVDEPDVSREHAVIYRRGRLYVIEDRHSRNGTFVNDEPISAPYTLEDSDVISLGGEHDHFCFHLIDTQRTRPKTPKPEAKTAGRLAYDEPLGLFQLDGRSLALTLNQHRLVSFLWKQKRICTREECAEAIWFDNGSTYSDSGALDRVIFDVRKKMKEIEPDYQFIVNRRGQGFLINPLGEPVERDDIHSA